MAPCFIHAWCQPVKSFVGRRRALFTLGAYSVVRRRSSSNLIYHFVPVPTPSTSPYYFVILCPRSLNTLTQLYWRWIDCNSLTSRVVPDKRWCLWADRSTHTGCLPRFATDNLGHNLRAYHAHLFAYGNTVSLDCKRPRWPHLTSLWLADLQQSLSIQIATTNLQLKAKQREILERPVWYYIGKTSWFLCQQAMAKV